MAQARQQEFIDGGYRDDSDLSPQNQALRGSQLLDDFLRGVGESERTFPIFEAEARGTQACGEAFVEHPETTQDMAGLKKFTTYEVRGTFNQTPFSSRKRYSDFVWFRAALVANLPGAFLPANPGKQMSGRFDKEFVEERRVRLQQFLQRLFLLPEVCQNLPLVQKFLSCGQQEFAALQKEIDARSDEDKLQDYRAVFAETLEGNSPPKSDKGFLMVKEFLDKHTPAVKVAQNATLELLKQQAAVAAKQQEVGRFLEELCDDEKDLFGKAGATADDLRGDLLLRLCNSMKCEENGKAVHTLNASLQREVEDCESAQECLLSIELLQQKLLMTKSKAASDQSSLATIKGDEAAPPDNGNLPPAAADEGALAQGMRKRDKTKEFFGKITSAVCDISAKAGINKERRMTELDQSIEKGNHEVEILEQLIASARTVFSATEITAFLETKVAGCLFAQKDFADKKLAMYQELANCWR